MADGDNDGALVGVMLGDTDGVVEEPAEGANDAIAVLGLRQGAKLGSVLGWTVGPVVCPSVGAEDGMLQRAALGLRNGLVKDDGSLVETTPGNDEGMAEAGLTEGANECPKLGPEERAALGTNRCWYKQMDLPPHGRRCRRGKRKINWRTSSMHGHGRTATPPHSGLARWKIRRTAPSRSAAA